MFFVFALASTNHCDKFRGWGQGREVLNPGLGLLAIQGNKWTFPLFSGNVPLLDNRQVKTATFKQLSFKFYYFVKIFSLLFLSSI